MIQTGDTGIIVGTPWVLGRESAEDSLVLMPDYGFFSWPEPGVGSFLEVRDKTYQFETRQTWSDKIPELFWRGALMIPLRSVPSPIYVTDIAHKCCKLETWQRRARRDSESIYLGRDRRSELEEIEWSIIDPRTALQVQVSRSC